jgi:hypothetical protein
MAGGDPLGPSAACPLADRCQACGTTRALEVATYQTPVGVFCATVCRRCLHTDNPPPVRSWGQACERVGAHCQHLGIDLDQMADLLHPDAEEGGRQVTDPPGPSASTPAFSWLRRGRLAASRACPSGRPAAGRSPPGGRWPATPAAGSGGGRR